jgi:oxygen-independent coproporphyrinogen-3 oxidase
VIGIYIHVPYCSVRCSYCDFYIRPVRQLDPRPFVAALGGEIRSVVTPVRGLAADSIHFGGGTPSLLSARDLGTLLKSLGESFRVSDDAEIGLEANPEDVKGAWLKEIARCGVNRLSVGVQSLDDRLLRSMRRPHSAAQAIAAIGAATTSRIRSIGVDLILGFPGQREEEALNGLRRLVDMGVQHVSIYILELHGRTRLEREIRLGRRDAMSDDVAAALFERASGLLVERGFEHYEVSNFALPGHRSRHNSKYWTDAEYLGFGPAAHSYLQGRRWWNAADLGAYLSRSGLGVQTVDDHQPPAVRGFEALCAGLRIAEGVDLLQLRARYGTTLPGPDDPAIEELREAGLLAVDGARLRMTGRGRLLTNEILLRLSGPQSARRRRSAAASLS